MQKLKHREKIEELFNKSPVVEFKSIERIIGVKKNSNYAKLLISNMLKKNKIHKIGKGFYTKHIESTLSVFAFNPSYLGLQNALSFHKMWEQETIPVILTTKKVRTGIRNIMNSNVLIRNMNKKYFFGFEFQQEGDFYIPYSDLEKTLIDMVLFNQKMSQEVISNIKRKIDKKKLNEYLKRYSLRDKKRVVKILELK